MAATKDPRQVPETAAHGLMFHHFFNAEHPKGQGAIDAGCFARLLKEVGIHRILPAEAWVERALAGKLRDGDLCLTFDDALRCQYDVALPVLDELGLTAFWFVYSSVFEGGREPLEIFRYFRTVAFPDIQDFYAAFDQAIANSDYAELVARKTTGVDMASHLKEAPFYTLGDRRFRYLRDLVLGPERYEAVMWQMIRAAGYEPRIPSRLLWLDDNNLRALAAGGHAIGLHSYSHPTRLADLPPDAQRTEYRRNRDHITRVTGRAPLSMSHPCGSYTSETLALLAEMGIPIGFRANMAQSDYSLLELPRIDHAVLLKQLNLDAA
jgi:peptidoglycan/xylan/chitin deacetylase (PgdA/CDA1 family)